MEEQLGFVADINSKPMEDGLNRIEKRVESTAKAVEKSGMSVDDFAKHMQGVLSSFEKLTQAVDRNTKAQEQVAEAGKKAADAEKQGADKATDAIQKTDKATQGLGSSLKRTGDEGTAGFDKLQKAAAGFFTLAAAKEFGQKVFEVRSEIQSLQTSFETLVGNKPQAEELFNSIKDFATHTPMQLKDLASAAQTMMSFNIPVEQIMENLKALGDVSMGDAQKFQSLSLSFSQMSATGKLMGQDLLQMINAGFNPLATISEKTGKSIEKLKDEMSKGAISADMVRQAFIDATSEGGKFYGMLEAQSKALGGAYSNLQGAISDMFNSIGEQTEGIMSGAINAATVLVQNYEKVGQILLGIVATYGTYKAAVIAVTLAETTATGQRMIAVRWTQLQAQAQAILNKTMLANPYVAAATALGLLVGAIIAARDGLTDAERAQRDYNDILDEAKKKQEDYNNETQEAIRLAQDDSAATGDRESAMQTLIERYPKIIQKYIDEKGHLTDILNLKREIAAYDGQMRNQDNKNRANMYKEYVRIINKQKRGETLDEREKHLYQGAVGIYNKATPWYQPFNQKGAIDYFTAMQKQASRAYGRGETEAKVNSMLEKMGDMKTDELKKLSKVLNANSAKIQKGQAVYVKEIGDYLEASDLQNLTVKANGILDARNPKKKELTDKEKKAAAKAAAKAAKEEQKQAKEEAAQDARQIQEELRYQDELRKIRQEASDARRDAEIASIQNDAERERAEQDEQHERNLRQIKEQANEMRKAIYEHNKKAWENAHKDSPYENTEPGKAGWMGLQLPEDQQAIIDAQLKKKNAEYQRVIRETEKDLISAHQSYIDKKIAIDEEYQEEVKKIDEAIAKAEERGDKQSVDALKRSRVEAAKQRNKEQADLSLEKLKESPEYIRAFEDLENTSTETLQIVIKNFEEAKAAAAENLDPKDFKEYTDVLNQMYDELSSRDPFKAMRDSLIEVKEAHTKVKEATDKYNRIMNGEKVLVGETNKETGEFNVRLLTEEEALQDVAEAKDRESRATTKFKKASRQAKDVVDELAGAVQNVGSSIGGMVGDIISLVGDITSVVNGALHAMENTSQGASAAIQAAEKASAILAIISAALQVIQKISGIVKGLFGANDAQEFEKAKAQYENLADIWDELIEKKREYLNESWGKEVMSAAEEANRLLEVEKEQLKILAQQGLGVTNGSHSMEYRMWKGSYSFNGQNWRDVAGEISKTLGVQFESMGDMLDMSAEQLQWIKENYIGLWANMDVNFKEALEKLIQFGDTEASIVEDSLTRLTGTTADDVFNDFLENLYDLADGSEDAMDNIAENWQKMVNRMVINNLIAGKMKEQLEGWYEDLAEINKQRSKNEIGDKEYQQSLADMQQRYNNLVAEGRSQMEQFTEMGIIKPLSEASEEAKEYFTNLRDSWLSTLTDMTADGKEWKQNILRTMFEDLVDATVLDVPVTVNGQTFDDFGKYLEDWTKRYKEAVESGNIEVMKALLDEQTTLREEQAKKSKEIADNLGYEIVNEFSNSIDNLSDTFLNNLLDLNADAEDMGKEIGSTLIQEMLKQMLASEQYANRMKEIKEHWQNALNGDEAYTYESVMAEITALNNDIANDEAIGALAAQWKELNKQVEQSKSPFSDLRSTFRGTLMSLESDAQSFADNLNNTILQDLLDKQVFSKPLTVAEKEFEDFDAYVADWNKRYLEAVENNETEAIEALITELTGVQGQLDEATKELRESLIRKQEDTTFKDMADSFVSSLMDVNSTAKDWAEDIGRTMAQKIIEQMVVAKQIQPLLDNLQKAFDTAMGTGGTWQTAVADTGVQLAMQQIKDAYPELQKLTTGIMNGLGVRMEEAKEGFSDLRGTLVSTLTDMEGDAQKLGKNIGQTMIQQMLDALVEKKYAERLKTINEQWADALESGDTTKIDSVRNAVENLYNTISNDSSVKQLADDLRELTKEAEETPLHGFRSNFLSQLTDMESDTKDFAAEINQILTEAFIDKFVLGDAFDERLAEWEKEYSKLMGDPEMSAEARAKALKQLGENIAAESETMKEQARAIQEMFNTGGEEYGDQQATVNMADKATYDQFEMYLGIATAQQITGEQQLGVTQQILYTLQAMSGITSPMGGMSEEMRNMWLISNQYLLDIKQSNREILNSFGLKLDSINVKLSKL